MVVELVVTYVLKMLYYIVKLTQPRQVWGELLIVRNTCQNHVVHYGQVQEHLHLMVLKELYTPLILIMDLEQILFVMRLLQHLQLVKEQKTIALLVINLFTILVVQILEQQFYLTTHPLY